MTTPPPSPITSEASSSSDEGSSSEGPRGMRNLEEIYSETDVINNASLFCLFTDCEPLSFEEATKNKKWRQVMEEEIDAIQRNKMWELATLPKGQKAIGVK